MKFVPSALFALAVSAATTSAFVPAPKVTSSIVQIVPLPAPRFPCSQTALETVTRYAFGNRRKMIRSSLKKIGGERLLKAAEIDPEKRPQELNIEEFCRLASLYEAQERTQPNSQEPY